LPFSPLSTDIVAAYATLSRRWFYVIMLAPLLYGYAIAAIGLLLAIYFIDFPLPF